MKNLNWILKKILALRFTRHNEPLFMWFKNNDLYPQNWLLALVEFNNFLGITTELEIDWTYYHTRCETWEKGFWIPWSRLFPGLGTLHCNGGSSRLVRSKRVRPWKRSGEEEGWHSLHSVQLRGGSCRVKFSSTMTRPPPWQERQGLLRKEWDLGAAIPATRTYSCMCKTDFLNLERKQSLYLDMLKIALWW